MDHDFYHKFATGSVPIPWQNEVGVLLGNGASESRIFFKKNGLSAFATKTGTGSWFWMLLWETSGQDYSKFWNFDYCFVDDRYRMFQGVECIWSRRHLTSWSGLERTAASPAQKGSTPASLQPTGNSPDRVEWHCLMSSPLEMYLFGMAPTIR